MASWRLSRRRRWLVCVATLFVAFGAWSIASPLMAPPDEAAHLFKAAAVAHGQLFGTPGPPLPGGGANPSLYVQVPGSFANAETLWPCYTFHLDRSAACAPDLHGPSSALVTASTYVGRYPPLYYLLVGWPSRLYPSAAGVYLIRLVSALLSALFVASALESARSMAGSRLMVLGVALAVTPMVLYLGATINPNGLEVTAALCLWASALALALDDRPAIDRRALARAGIAAAVLVQMRGLSPLWLALIAVSVLALARRARIMLVLRDRAARWWLALVGLSSAFALWWIVHFQTLVQIGGQTPPAPPSTTVPHLVTIAFGFADTYVRGMIGLLGHPDIQGPPSLVLYLWLTALALLVGLSLVLGRRREAWVLGAVVVAVVVIPTAFDAAVATRYGFMWQGRYTLPLAVGMPILAGASLRDVTLSSPAAGRLRILLPAGLGLAQAAMFLWGLWRYSVGETPPGRPYHFSLDVFSGTWQPPFGSFGIFLIFLVGLTGYSLWLASAVRPLRRSQIEGLPASLVEPTGQAAAFAAVGADPPADGGSRGPTSDRGAVPERE